MAKQKERSELEALRAENKKLAKENAHLKRAIQRKEKREHQYEDIDDKLRDIRLFEEVQEHSGHPVINNRCDKCQDGILEEIDLGIKVLIKCTVCRHHMTRKN